MVKITLYLGDETAAALKRIARSQRRSQSELIREALARYVEATLTPAPPGVGRYCSGRRDVGVEAEVILRRRSRAGR